MTVDFKPKFIELLKMYKVAPVIKGQQMVCKAWIVLLLAFFTGLQIITPYVQKGCKRVLYNMNLRDNVRLE